MGLPGPGLPEPEESVDGREETQVEGGFFSLMDVSWFVP